MGASAIVLHIGLTFPDDSIAEEREEMALRLREELLETDVIAVKSSEDRTAPQGAKGLPAGLDTLLVTLAGSGSILGTVLTTTINWLAKRKECSVTVKLDGDEITLTNPSAEDQHRLIAAFLKRHSVRES